MMINSGKYNSQFYEKTDQRSFGFYDGYHDNQIEESKKEDYMNHSMGFPFQSNVDSYNNTWENYEETTKQCTHIQRSGCMSFVMMMNSLHGIVVVADSRSTVGDTKEEGQKAFKGKNYLLATWGNNRLVVDEKPVKLEDALRVLIKKYPDNYQGLLENFRALLYENNNSMNCAFHFFIGGHYESEKYPGNDGYFIKEYQISAEGIDLIRAENTIANLRFAGDLNLMPRGLSVNPNWTVMELEQKGRILLQNIISIGDAFLSYNPGGGAIQVVSYTVE